MRSEGAPFRCQMCAKTFARREHLRRHEQGHTNSPSPSNQCTTCGKFFSRRDALLRHRALHIASSTSNGGGNAGNGSSFGGPRSRAATNRTKRACARCSRQKLKCDGQVPCERCGNKGHECVYPESPSSSSSQPMTMQHHHPTNNDNHHDQQSMMTQQQHQQQAHTRHGDDYHRHYASSSTMSDAYDQREVSQVSPLLSGDYGMPTPSSIHSGGGNNTSMQHVASPPEGYGRSHPAQRSHSYQHPPSSSHHYSSHHHHHHHNNHPSMGSSRDFDEQRKPPTRDFVRESQHHQHHSPMSMAAPATPALMPPSPATASIAAAGAAATIPPPPPPPPPQQAAAAGRTREELSNSQQQQPSQQTTAPTLMETDDGSTFDWLFSSSLFPPPWQPLDDQHQQQQQQQHQPQQQQNQQQQQQQQQQNHSHETPIPSTTMPPTTPLVENAPPTTTKPSSNAYERNSPTELPNTSVVGPDEGRVRFHMLGTPHPSTLMAENTCQVAPLLQVAKDRLLLLPTLAGQIPEEEKQGTQKMLAAVSPEALNVFVQLYFQHFDRLCSVVHRPTFDPNYCEVFLLGAICALGAMYSAIENASRFGHSLMSLVNRAIFGVWPRTREYGRSLPFIQALLLNFNFFRSSGTREMLELAESLRSPLTTMVRKCRLLESTEGRPATSALHEDWKAWIESETRKRTAWAYFAADMELAMVWSLAPSFAFDELNAELPGDNARWMAASAATWRSIGDNAPKIFLNQLHTDPHALYLCGSGAQKVAFASSLCSLGTSLHSMRSSCLDAVIDMATNQLVQTCQSLRFTGNSTALPELLLRFMMLISTIDTYDLQALVRAADTDAAFERVARRLTRASALEHVLVQAGRIVGLCRTEASDSLYEGCFFFYAASALYGCSRVLLSRGVPVGCAALRIDDGMMPLSPICEPFRPLLEGIGDMTAQDAPWRILDHYAGYLRNRPPRTAWPITGLLGRFLTDMAASLLSAANSSASSSSAATGGRATVSVSPASSSIRRSVIRQSVVQ